MTAPLDAIVVGSGPNGLGAAIALAREGKRVRVYEASSVPGGGVRSAALTLPGFVHDTGAAVHALAFASPFFRSLPLAERGLEFAQPEVPFAHPLDDRSAVLVHRSVAETADGLDRADSRAYRRLMTPFVDEADALLGALLDPRRMGHIVRHGLLLARFGVRAIRSAESLAHGTFRGERARSMFAGVAAHSVLPLDGAATAGFALGLTIAAHAHGWPVARGGSQEFTDALIALLESLGGEVVTGTRVTSLAELPAAHAVLLDVTPRQFLELAGDRLPDGYRRRMSKYRYGPGVFKMDWALREPVPWTAASVARAGTVHIGGSFADIARSEREVWADTPPERPYVLAVQPSLADPTRAPAGAHTLWAYCHVPNGSTADMTGPIEAQLERFAPGFRDVVIGRSTMSPADLERDNANLVGGDIAGGAADLVQFVTRPVPQLDPHRTPIPGVYLCSSSTPPGVGVHGMSGFLAARSALRHSF